jgi:hypothetical protein
MLPANGNVIDCMVDVGWKDTNGIGGQPYARSDPQPWYKDQCQRSGNLCEPCQENHRAGKGHPIGRYFQEPARGTDMGNASNQVNDAQQNAEANSCSRFRACHVTLIPAGRDGVKRVMEGLCAVI